MPCVCIRRPAPQFKGNAVVNRIFEEIKLSDFLGKWVVLFFYPMDFTFVCPTEILAFNARLSEFTSLNAHVIGVSTDSEYAHLAWCNMPRSTGGLGPGMKMTLLADKTMSISRDYGVLIEDMGVSLRGLFLIDPKGILRQMTINDLPVGRSVDETLRLIKAFQFTDEYGEVCPADWDEKTNAATIDTSNAGKYFRESSKKTSLDMCVPSAVVISPLVGSTRGKGSDALTTTSASSTLTSARASPHSSVVCSADGPTDSTKRSHDDEDRPLPSDTAAAAAAAKRSRVQY